MPKSNPPDNESDLILGFTKWITKWVFRAVISVVAGFAVLMIIGFGLCIGFYPKGGGGL